MGKRIPKEERFFPRYFTVAPGFPGRLTAAGRDIGGNVLDVSRDGIGALLPVQLQKGDVVELSFDDKRITFQVAHCNEDLIHKGQFRCGLRRTGSTENLESLFRVAGYLANEG